MSGSIGYSYGITAPRHGRVTTSQRELTQIAIAFAVLTVDLLLLLSEGTFLGGFRTSGPIAALSLDGAALAATAAFSGFVAHELAHKIVAQRRGYWAEFRMWPIGLVLSLVTAIIGFLWAMPGATMVGGIPEWDRESWGLTSVAGPLSNVGFGVLFFAGGVGAFAFHASVAYPLLYLAFINGWFGTFNLLPFGPLDGRKVLRWSPSVWAGALAFTLVVLVVSILAVVSIVTFQTPFRCYTAFDSCL